MRIIGGRFRSRALRAPRGTATRPTSDRVREALFSMLASDGVLGTGIEGDPAPRVLDLYAGSGALGLEALSRGAASAVLVEQARDAVVAIRENVRALGVDASSEIMPCKVESALETLRKRGRFALVFADPPYADVAKPAFAETLARVALVVDAGGTFVLEHASADEPPVAPDGLALDRSRRHGDTAISIYRRA